MGYQALIPKYPLRIEQIVSAHYFEYTSNYFFEGEQHDFWEFLYVDKGRLTVQAGDTEHLLEKGQIIFHRPGEFHALRACGVAPNLVVVSFVCNSSHMQFFERKIVSLDNTQRALLAQVIKEAEAAFSNPMDDPTTMQLIRRETTPFGAEQLIVTNLEQLLISLIRNAATPPKKQSSVTRTQGQNEFMEGITSYMEANIARRLTLTDVCRDNLVGRSYLQKFFREHTGGGAMEYFGKLKIETAKEYIRNRSHNFTEISSLLGYNSIHYFSRHFKKVTGMTPTEYASSVKVLSSKNRVD